MKHGLKNIHVIFSGEVIDAIKNECMSSPGTETGGILLGNVIEAAGRKLLLIKATSGPGPAAVKKPAMLAPDIDYYNSLLIDAVNNRGFEYIGEWHKHPAGFESTSYTDLNQVKKIFVEEGRDFMLCPIVIKEPSAASSKFKGRGGPCGLKIKFSEFVMNSYYICRTMIGFDAVKSIVAHANTALYRNLFQKPDNKCVKLK